MEPSKEAIAVRITRLNRQILGKVTSGTNKLDKKTIDREALLDALTVLYDECNDDPVKKSDELVRAFVDKYRSTLAELRRTRVCLSDFDVVQTIGRGHFGDVHMVREKQTSDVYALKSIRKEHARRRGGGAPEDEREVLAAASSPWIPRLQYAFQDSNTLYLVMELCSGGDLSSLLARRNHPLSERDAAFYVAEVAHALKALHGMGFVHRDVKPHNILLDRCGHVKLGDFGSCARLSAGGSSSVAVGTPDYVAPELLAAAHCALTHSVCLQYCRGIVTNAISSCDYWSLGVVAFELVTLKRPFSAGDDDSLPKILSNIQKYERESAEKGDAEPPFEPMPRGPSAAWRALVAGLLRVAPPRRYSYLDTLQHPALAHIAPHSIRDQAPPWVPCVRGAEDTSYFSVPAREPPLPNAAPFRARPPFAGQLPFVGFSYVAPEESEDSMSGFNASHDCTAIDLATFKSAEKLAAMRSKEIVSLQNKLASSEAAVGAAVERARRDAEEEAERTRARLQADITALSLQNKRLERQVEVEKEERMNLQRRNQELTSGIEERNSAETRQAHAAAEKLRVERDALREDLKRLEIKVEELQTECSRALSAADTARAQHLHYKDTIAKERAIRRQTLSGGEAESREAGARLAAAEAATAREARAKEMLEKQLASLEKENNTLHKELDEARLQLASTQECLSEKQRSSNTCSEQLKETQVQLAHERMRVSMLLAQVQELERGVEESARREAALEEQSARTEARLNDRLRVAEERTTAVLGEDARHREKVSTLEQLVRQLEREVSAMESRGNCNCTQRGQVDTSEHEVDNAKTTPSDTESVGDGPSAAQAQLALLKEQLERAEAQLQARAEEMATLRQEARAANLARWRKEREFNDLQVEAKSTTRDLKRAEERLSTVLEARKTAEQKASALQSEIATLRPKYEEASKENERLKDRLTKLQKVHETAQAEVDRSRNDIRKLKSELLYSERRRLHAEEQEEQSSRERGQLRDELHELRTLHQHTEQNNKALQEACSVLEEQLTDLEKLADFHEVKSKDLENEMQRVRVEVETCRSRLAEAEREAREKGAAATLAASQHEEAREQARHAHCQLQLLQERLESREARVAELESSVASLEAARCASEAALGAAGRRVRALQEECATLRTAAHHHHSHALALQASLADTQEELAAAREAAEAATVWWRTRETKADATLRQQAKLIDFLQAKVEEAGRKKCSLSNKLFGRSGRRPAASPPLRRANRELREEVERLRAKLAGKNDVDPGYPTPRRDKPRNIFNGSKGIDTPDCPDTTQAESLLVVWPDGARERMRARLSDGVLVLTSGHRELRARLYSADANNLPQNEANRAFAVKLESNPLGSEASLVCSNVAERALWVDRLSGPGCRPSLAPGYRPTALLSMPATPAAALYLAPNAVAIGANDGLHSLRGVVKIEWDLEGAPVRPGMEQCRITALGAAGGRALVAAEPASTDPMAQGSAKGGLLAHGGLLALGSTLRRAASLQPTLQLSPIYLPDTSPPHLIKTITGDAANGPCAAVSCGRRVFLLRYDASTSEFKIARSLTVDRSPNSLLLTPKCLYIAGEKPLKVNLPSGALEAFAMDEVTVAAAAKKHSPPRAILLVSEAPVELLVCYAECGVFVDGQGRRTRSLDPRWAPAARAWCLVPPFLYVLGTDHLAITHLPPDACRAPPCTCDTTSIASSTSDCCMPDKYDLKLDDPILLGTTPSGIIVRTKVEGDYEVVLVEGQAAFRSIGASVESLETVSDTKGSSSDLAQSMTDLLPQDASQESVEPTTGFLADIRRRARQLRAKNRKDQDPDDVIKEILTTEVGLKRPSNGRKSPATTSEFDSDSTDGEDGSDCGKSPADVCAEMFTRQVRFE